METAAILGQDLNKEFSRIAISAVEGVASGTKECQL
jgi:hypothetical protein